MACEIDIKQAASVTLTAPAPTDLVLMILENGTAVFRTWASLMATLVPDDYERIVDDGVSPDEINTGDAGKTLAQFAGYRVRLIRGGIPQSQIPQAGASYYTYDKPTGTFVFVPIAQKDELFQIQAY